MEQNKDQSGAITLERAGFKLASHVATPGGPIMASVTDVYEKDGMQLVHSYAMGGESWSVGAAVRGEAVAGHEAHFARLTLIRASGDEELIEAVKMGEVSIQAALEKVLGATSVAGSSTDWRIYHSALSKCADLLDNMADNDALIDVPVYLAAKLSARAADAPSEPSELRGIPTLRDLAELFHASAMSNTAVLIHPESARSLFDAMTTPPKDDSVPLSYACRVEPHQDRIILDDKYESIDTVRAALAKSRAADALDSQPTVIAYVATDLDGRADVGMTPEKAMERAGHGCDTIIPVYDLGSSQPTDGGVRNG